MKRCISTESNVAVPNVKD